MTELGPNSELVFFLGAGFSSELAGVPLNRELMGTLFSELTGQDGPSWGPAFADDLRSVGGCLFPHLKGCEQDVDIELLLSLLRDMETTHAADAGRLLKNLSPRRIRDGLVAALGHVLAVDVPPYSGDPIRSLVELFLDLRARTSRFSVITTNYDLLADKAQGVAHDRLRLAPHEHSWDPRTEDPARYNYGFHVRGMYRRSEGDLVTARGPRVPDPGIQVLKLHGSINWAYCKQCDQVDLSTHRAELWSTFSFDPDPCSRGCGAQYSWIIVPPEPLKEYSIYPPLLEVWERAEKALAGATHVFFIGYSLPPADPFVRVLLARSRAKAALAASGPWQYWLFNRDAAVVERFRNSLGDGMSCGPFTLDALRSILSTVLV